ncbi:MAG: alkaline phosphatase family protein [Longimicrobiales bacterium]
MRYKRVVAIGLDGLEPSLVEAMLDAGELPHLARIREAGGYARVGTTLPAQTPVAWSTFAVGANPGTHGIFDFLSRDPQTYLPEIALYRHEERGRFLPPRAVNLRGGVPLWERLSQAGIRSTVLRHPCTYPPDPFKGRLLSGIGVPDLRGGFGSSSFFTDDAATKAGESEHLFLVAPGEDGRFRMEIPGPVQATGSDLRLSLEVEVLSGAAEVEISCPDGSFSVPARAGEWTPWVQVRIRQGLLQSVRGLVRFFLADLEPLRLFVTPIHFDPDAPLFPISHPWDYAGELRRVLGPYATLGLAEEHNGLTNGRFSEEAFLAQCLDVLHERKAMMHHELGRHEEGLFYCLFATPDRIQHMFWRFREPDHPANRGKHPSTEMTRVIEDYYRRCDGIMGEASEYADPETLVMVISDHGFTSFQRQVDLNAWLYENGYLALKRGVEPGEGAGDLLRNVDWGRTRAYALGMAGLYLNLRGREAEGIVGVEDAPVLKEEIARRLVTLTDPDRGGSAIRAAKSREAVYAGPYVDRAPDVLVGCAPGYRVSGASAMGSVGSRVVSDNLGRWSGDHVVDPAAVPGVLFMSAPFREEAPTLADLAPTALEALGVPKGAGMEGDSLLP